MNVALIMDIAVGVFLIIFAVIGFKKGFFRELVDLGGVILAFFIASNLAPIIANALQSWFGLRDMLASAIEGGFASMEGFDTVLTEEGLSVALEKIGIPSFICDPIVQAALNIVPEGSEGLTVAAALSTVFASYVLSFICGIVIFLLCQLFLKIIVKFLTKLLDKIPVVGLINRFLGFILGALIGFVYVYVALSLLSVIPVEGLQEILDQTVFINFLYQNNLLLKFLNAIAFFEKFFKADSVMV